MKRFFKMCVLWTISFLLGVSSISVCLAQVKKGGRQTAGKRISLKAAASAKPMTELDNCLASRNTAKPARNDTAKTKQGFPISDCEPTALTALYQPKLVYPKTARGVGVAGSVSIDAVIDEGGRVVWVKPLNGNPFLQVEALRTACLTRFKPMKNCIGQSVKVYLVINYNFITGT